MIQKRRTQNATPQSVIWYVQSSECTSQHQSELTAFIWILNPLRLLPSLHRRDVYDQQTLCLLEFKILAEHILKDTILNLLFQFAM